MKKLQGVCEFNECQIHVKLKTFKITTRTKKDEIFSLPACYIIINQRQRIMNLQMCY